MDPIQSVTNWFKRLAMGRVHAAKAQARAKVYSQQAKAKSKVAGKFNKSIDQAVNKSKAKVTGKQQGKSRNVKSGGTSKKQDKDMGLFGRKEKDKNTNQPQSEDLQMEADEHTVALSIDEQPEEFQECVGWVVIRNGPMKGKDFRLTAGKNVLGTTADCEIVLTDPYLSSKHCVVRYEEGEFTMVDLDSTNGTFVNNNRVVKTSLVDNDSIRVGRTDLKFKALQ